MKNQIFLILGTILLAMCFSEKKEEFSQNGGRFLSNYEKIYIRLKKEWNNIFPDSNRNAGGVQFFNYIYEVIKPTKEEFDIYNMFYCGVSGSLIHPKNILKDGKFESKNNSNDFVLIKHIDGYYVSGFYYRCCWPCSCDIMNENMLDVLAEDIKLNLKDGTFNYTVLTIPDPCRNSIIINSKEVLPDPNNNNRAWSNVSSFKCFNKKTVNATHTESDRIIFALLYNPKKRTINEYKNSRYYDENLNSMCKKRNNAEEGLQNWGMGDIFVNLSKKESI